MRQDYFSIETISCLNDDFNHEKDNSKKLSLARQIFQLSHYAFSQVGVNDKQGLHDYAIKSLEKHMEAANDLPLKRAIGEVWVALVTNGGHLDVNNFTYYDDAINKIIVKFSNAENLEEKKAYARMLTFSQKRIANQPQTGKRINQTTNVLLDSLVEYPELASDIGYDMARLSDEYIMDISIENEMSDTLSQIVKKNPGNTHLLKIVNYFYENKPNQMQFLISNNPELNNV